MNETPVIFNESANNNITTVPGQTTMDDRDRVYYPIFSFQRLQIIKLN